MARRPIPGRRAFLIVAVVVYGIVRRARVGHLRYQRDFYRDHLIDMGRDPDRVYAPVLDGRRDPS